MSQFVNEDENEFSSDEEGAVEHASQSRIDSIPTMGAQNPSGMASSTPQMPTFNANSPLSVKYDVFRNNRKVSRTFVFDLLNEKIFQRTDTSTPKYIYCYNILNSTIIGNHNLLIEFRKRGIQTTNKFVKFTSHYRANAFKHYIDYIREFGEFVKKAFDAIDTIGAGCVDAAGLLSILKAVDIDATQEDAISMIDFANSNHDRIVNEKNGKSKHVSYNAFFHVFLHSHARTVREFISEWIHRTACQDEDPYVDDEGSVASSSCASQSSRRHPDRDASGYHKTRDLILLQGEEITESEIPNIRWCIGSNANVLAGTPPTGIDYCAIPQTTTVQTPATTSASSSRVLNNPPIWHQSCVLGKLIVTNYRVLLISYNVKSTSTGGIRVGLDEVTAMDLNEHSRYSSSEFHSILSIPLTTIARLQMVPHVPNIATTGASLFSSIGTPTPQKNNNMLQVSANVSSLMTLVISCKDLRVIKILLPPSNISSEIVLHEEDEDNGLSSSNHAMSVASFSAGRPQSGLFGTGPSREVVENNIQIEELYNSLVRACFPKLCFNQLRDILFAYQYKKRFTENGWDLSNVLKEYVRQGLINSNYWKVYDNTDYSLCETYPSHLILPASMPNSSILCVANHRSRHRIPAVTYRHASSGAVIARSAQPTTGLLTKVVCKEDIDMLNCYRLAPCATFPQDLRNSRDPTATSDYAEGGHAVSKKHYIVDARSFLAATANKALGKGTEDAGSYANSEVIYCNIENIHTMRAALSAMGELLLPGGYDDNLHGDFYVRLGDIGWFKHIRAVTAAGVVIAEKIHLEGCSVTTHCSDGWDRTAQVVCIAQLILEPYYRTIEGFAVLIEKDWCSFGHKFQDRCGHGEVHSSGGEERSPVFLQFLDAVFQMTLQFPTAFQFASNLLIFLADHTFSGLFGNFLGNSDMERHRVYEVTSKTQSIWSYVYEYSDRFLNDDYEAYDKCIWPSGSVKQLSLWNRYFSRWETSAIPKAMYAANQWHDDWCVCLSIQ